jgi:hypothetical protein
MNTITAPALFPVEVAAAGRHHVLLVGPEGPDRLTAAMRVAAALPAGVPFQAVDGSQATVQEVEDAVKAAEEGVLFVNRLDMTGWASTARLMPAVRAGRLWLIGAVSEIPGSGADRIFEFMPVRLPVMDVVTATASDEPTGPVDESSVKLDHTGLDKMKAARMAGTLTSDDDWRATARVAKTVAAMLGYRRVNAGHVRAALAWRNP